MPESREKKIRRVETIKKKEGKGKRGGAKRAEDGWRKGFGGTHQLKGIITKNNKT